MDYWYYVENVQAHAITHVNVFPLVLGAADDILQ